MGVLDLWGALNDHLDGKGDGLLDCYDKRVDESIRNEIEMDRIRERLRQEDKEKRR